jgi:hypothetical protein
LQVIILMVDIFVNVKFIFLKINILLFIYNQNMRDNELMMIFIVLYQKQDLNQQLKLNYFEVIKIL